MMTGFRGTHLYRYLRNRMIFNHPQMALFQVGGGQIAKYVGLVSG